MVSRKRGGMCRPWEAVAEERRLGFSHSHNDEFNWDAFHAWQVKNDGA
jgi:phytanoyl-CoA hydroxylase